MNRFTRAFLTEIREIVFGLEDGMVSTLGAITGLAAATQSQPLVIVSGLVIIAVESLSMAAGTYLSNKSEQNALSQIHRMFFKPRKSPSRDGVYMGISYIIGGNISLLPYFFLPINLATPLSIVSVVTSLFFLGFSSGRLTRRSGVIAGLEMTIVSVSAALIGYLVGQAASYFFPSIRAI